MIKNLVIVESPAKAKTIEKFLGKDYKVMSSYGHIRDLKKKNINIDNGTDFTPVYEISEDKTELVKQLKKAAKEAEMVWLASDEDREGEAISWHLYEVLGLKPDNTRRIVFHEITKDAILHAIANPRDIDINLVDAQQARRVLDRIVGFELSPVLWRKIKPALSAGRVQSVAVRLIVERENEIRNFVPEQYFRVTAEFSTADGALLKADLSKRLSSEQEARAFLEDCKAAGFTIADISVKPLRRQPAPPFTTSTLQQEAARRLGFTVSQTMMVAQRLYEAGHITYMRTDSLNLSSLAIATISKQIKDAYGDRYLHVRNYHTNSKGAQEAHEAIRPTYISKEKISGTAQEQRLYQLIWRRAVASQMADAEIEKNTADIAVSTRSEHFTAVGETIRFDGFLKLYNDTADDAERLPEGVLPPLHKGEALLPVSISALERFTQHPPRYNEASLVKKMEELGIGRPSTYAPTISTIQQREYVAKGDFPGERRQFVNLVLADGKIALRHKTENVGADKGKLIPTDTGTVVNDFLTEHFPNVLDYNFTAAVEGRFDEIARGNTPWKKEIGDFYDVFHPEVVKANDMRMEHKVGERLLGIDPKSGKEVFVKIGRFGPVAQIGQSGDDQKPQFAPLRKTQSVFDITLEEALKLFEMPKVIGEFEGKEVSLGSGRFGPYLKHDGKFVSIPRAISPDAITIDQAIELIVDKRDKESKKLVKSFAEDPDLQILNGRFGVYISYKKDNYKIPKTVADPAALTLDECRQIIADQKDKPKKKVRATARKK